MTIVNIQPKFFDESARTATYLELSDINIAPDGSSAKMEYIAGDKDHLLAGRGTFDFTHDEIVGFNNMDFANFGLIDYALSKKGMVRV